MEQTHALGRRKTAVARVYLSAGAGNITINGRPVEDYFKEDTLRYIVMQAFTETETTGKFDAKVTIFGGGTKGQAEAVRLGIARALCEIDKEAYRPALKAAGFSPATHVRLSVRNLVSQAHADASSSVNVSYYYCFLRTVAVMKLSPLWRLPRCGKSSRLA